MFRNIGPAWTYAIDTYDKWGGRFYFLLLTLIAGCCTFKGELKRNKLLYFKQLIYNLI
jgi:hypothetical protein